MRHTRHPGPEVKNNKPKISRGVKKAMLRLWYDARYGNMGVDACMLGQTGGSSRLRGASFTPTEQNHTCGELLRRIKPVTKPVQFRYVSPASRAQRQWRSLGARSLLDARSFMISTLRSQVGFTAAVAHARLCLSRLKLIRGLWPHSRPLRAPSFRRPPSSRRGEALWEREAAGSGSLGAASSESAAGSVR